MNMTQAKAKADVLKALGHPVRVLMLEALSRGDRCVNDMRVLAAISQPSISRHLAWLKRAGIVTERRAGPRVYHHLACPCMLQALRCADAVVHSPRKRPSDTP
jgi:DNA-binding transcriptional ArsR family regulator